MFTQQPFRTIQLDRKRIEVASFAASSHLVQLNQFTDLAPLDRPNDFSENPIEVLLCSSGSHFNVHCRI